MPDTATGFYADDAEDYIRAFTKQWLLDQGLGALWTSRIATEVYQYILADAPWALEAPEPHVVNVRNGLLHLHPDGSVATLEPHTPDYLSSVQLGAAYDPRARCPAWERFVAEVWPEDAVEAGVPWELAALLMQPHPSVQKAVLLTGAGANGKSAQLRAYTAFLHERNVTAVSLHRLEEDRFSAARLVNKLANICPDLPSEQLAGTSTFKAIVGGDRLMGERKFKPAFEFTPFCRLVFSTNDPPRSKDGSDGFFRRWLVIPFDRVFEGATARPRAALDAELAEPEELAGVLNHALAALPRVRSRGVTETPRMRVAWGEFRALTDPLAVWLDQETVDDPAAQTPRRLLHQAYLNACRRDNRPPMNDRAFGRALRQHRPHLRETQPMIAGKQERCWQGIGLLQPASGTAP